MPPDPTTWTHELPMRWADLDMLNHVNNVTYLEYAAEAQALLVRDAGLRPESQSDVVVTFVAPVMLSRVPVTIVSTLAGDVLTQEIRSGEEGATLNARIVSTWARPAAPRVPDGAEGPIPVRVRVGDVDATGLVSVPKTFELFQESRVLLIANHLRKQSFGQFVVGTVAVRIHDDLTWRDEPYRADGWVSRVGNGSFTVETVIGDAGRPRISATSVLVGFDMETQRSRTFTDEERATMRSALLS